ncbi:MAG: hypothetical protein A2W25_02750 [candidate division Zixibacteria bacterium RBG_16_53_22]|nr:MAG: hypothetical protein A2W25_02750 [candidate division Zixibacteria bacterium RBG_16_53_22]
MASTRHRQLPLARVARIGIFSALAFGINAPFLAIPNIELFSLALFLAGLFIGPVEGTMVGLVAGAIFVLFNPNGPQTIIFVGLAQLFGFALFGLSGGLLRNLFVGKKANLKSAILLILIGAFLTLWYDLSTNLIFAILFGPFWPTLIAGIGFALLHIASNAVIFGMSSLVIDKIWKRIEYYMPPLAG